MGDGRVGVGAGSVVGKRVGTRRATTKGMAPRRLVRRAACAARRGAMGSCTCWESKNREAIKTRKRMQRRCRSGRGRGCRESTEMAAVYQASSSRALKPALDAVEMWTAGGADNDERSTSKQKEIIEGEGGG